MAHVATITIDHTKVPGDLTDYVGLIVPDGSAGYAALYALCLEGGGDIRLFKSDDTTEIAREIVSFSVSAETGEIHYRYSGTLSSSVDTDIHVYADGSSSEPAASATYGSEAVWADYVGVWHMQESSGSIGDSTGNGLTGTALGTPVYSQSGPFGKAIEIDKSSDEGFGVSYDSILNLTNTWSIQGWFFVTSYESNKSVLMGRGFSGSNVAYALGFESTSPSYDFNSGFYDGTWRNAFGSGSADTWSKITGTYDGSTIRTYVNDATVATFSRSASALSSTRDFGIGRRVDWSNSGTQGMSGKLREIRIRDSKLPANDIETEYNNQNSPSTFYSVAAVAGGSAAQAARRGAVMMM